MRDRQSQWDTGSFVFAVAAVLFAFTVLGNCSGVL